MKKFIYDVNGIEYSGAEAFGEAWKQAKAEAIKRQSAIYRTVINGENVRREVYCKGGYFNSTKYTSPEEVKIF